MGIVEKLVEFQSQGVTCRGLFVRPQHAARAPLVVLTHGLGGVYEMRLDAYARRFAQAGYAALTFDYRCFGRSDGRPRHLLVRAQQQADIAAAITFGKSLEGVDDTRVVLWGTSLAGGHMIDVASGRTDIAALIIQAPFTDGLASFGASSFASVLGLAPFVVADRAVKLAGNNAVLAFLAAPPHLPALMTKPDVVEGVLKLLPEGSRMSKRLSTLYRTFARRSIDLPANVSLSDQPEGCSDSDLVGSIILPSGTALVNGVSANFALDVISWRPGKKLKSLRCPTLVCVADDDSVAPSGPTIAYAKQGPKCELRSYPYGHFDFYIGEPFEVVTRDQLAFLHRTVPTASASSAAERGADPAH